MMPDKVNILVVDDLPDKLLVLESVLAELGENVITARSGTEALRLVLRHEFAVILLDVNMPDVSGLETAALIRARKRTAHTPIIFVTAYADEMLRAEGYSLGAVDYILSPVVPEVLRAKVKVFVDLYRMNLEVKRHAEQRVALAREQAAREAAERSAEALRQSEERIRCQYAELSAIYASAPVGLCFLDRDLRFVSVNERLAQFSGAPVEAHLGHSLSEVVPALAPRLEALLRRVLDTGEPMIGLEFRSPLPSRPQEQRDWLVTLYPVKDEGGAVMGINSVVQDISARKRAEEALAEANRRKDEFLSMLAHELRNPLAPIRNAVEIMRLHPTAEPELDWARDVIERNVRQLVRLVDDLLDVSRITQGKIRLQAEPVSLAAVVTQAVEVSQPLIDARRHQLSVSLPEPPVWVNGDATRLAQVVANLLNNAAKYTDEGGRIELAVRQEGDEVVLRVRDNGVGIPAELLPVVFEPFTQGEQALDRSQGGLGIGLTLVQRLVELHGGSVGAYSAGSGQGSEFVVRLPLLRVEAVRRSSAAGGDPAAGGGPGRRVLLVDDNVDSVTSLAVLLRLAGHEVALAHEGASALEAAQSFRPEVVLLDIGLPGMSGHEVARRLRERTGPARPLLVALTGYGQEEDLRRSREAGFDHHLVKPVDIPHLMELLASGRHTDAGPNGKALYARNG